jgi:hypothetical protein
MCGLLMWTACGGDSDAPLPPPPSADELGLSEAEKANYAPISFDKLFAALSIAEDDSDALESVIKRVNRKIVGWSGVVQSTRIVKKGLEVSEFSLNVAPPSQAGAFVPKTLPVLVRAPNDDPVASTEKGTPVVFVGRLEFDGFSRDPWVLDARLVQAESAN